MNRETGKCGEDIAVEYLKKQGYEIIERNKHFSRNCEIDIIAKFKSTYVFVEVKTRTTAKFGSPVEAVTKTKYNNIKTGLFMYLQEKSLKNVRFQIDVISIVLKPEVSIQHLKNVSF